MNWSKVCSPYVEVGLNVKSMRVLNISLLLYSLWVIVNYVDMSSTFITNRLFNKNGYIRADNSSSVRSGMRIAGM